LAVSSASGDIEPTATHGVFFEDTRFVSTWRVRLDGEELQNLAVISRHPFAATFVGINFAAGPLAETPIALREVQGYVFAAYVARAEIARRLGDEKPPLEYDAIASRLRTAFNEQFWLKDRGYFAAGLDGQNELSMHSPPTSVTAFGRASSTRPRLQAPWNTYAAERCLRDGEFDPGQLDGEIQPGELSQRFGVASRQGDLRRRACPVRLSQASRSGDSGAI
jgi:hypothetical protein